MFRTATIELLCTSVITMQKMATQHHIKALTIGITFLQYGLFVCLWVPSVLHRK
jgi:hypothetical protein